MRCNVADGVWGGSVSFLFERKFQFSYLSTASFQFFFHAAGHLGCVDNDERDNVQDVKWVKKKENSLLQL